MLQQSLWPSTPAALLRLLLQWWTSPVRRLSLPRQSHPWTPPWLWRLLLQSLRPSTSAALWCLLLQLQKFLVQSGTTYRRCLRKSLRVRSRLVLTETHLW